MDDAALVGAARSGDAGALAAIYDRYADRLHDFCVSILRDPHEAADAFHDAFLAASQRLDQLRDPAKLRPWLFAIARHEALRRARARSRQQPSEELGEVRAPDIEFDAGARREEAVQLVWAAAAGLADRDRALLDLNVRQGLEGSELAAAIGVEPGHAYVLLSRLRDRLERSLGALLIARLGRDDCAELARILEGWDGRFSPLLRKRVARHADRCEVCAERRRTLANPYALLSLVPVVPAPARLRDAILGDTQLAAASHEPSWTASEDGFPPPAYPDRRPRWPAAAAAGIAVAVMVVTLLAGWSLGGSGGSEVPLVAAGGAVTSLPAGSPPPAAPSLPVPSTQLDPSTQAEPETSTTAASPAPATGPVTTDGSTSSIAPSPVVPTPAPGPRLELAAVTIEFGSSARERPLELVNDGGQVLSWSLARVTDGYSVAPSGGTIPPGGAATATVVLDRSRLPEGAWTGTVEITSDGGDGSARLGAMVLRPPSVRASVSEPALRIPPCSLGPVAASVSARVADESPVGSVVLRWTGRSAGSAPLTSTGNGSWSGRIGPFTAAGTVTWWVEATDEHGATGRTPDRTIAVDPCSR